MNIFICENNIFLNQYHQDKKNTNYRCNNKYNNYVSVLYTDLIQNHP